MGFALRILPAADADVDGAAEHIARDDAETALRFYDAVERTYLEIQRAPERWAIYRIRQARLQDIRKRSVRDFAKYLVFYRIDHATVEIVRVLHGARDIPAVLLEEPGDREGRTESRLKEARKCGSYLPVRVSSGCRR